ncbi:MAG: LPS translocon maturation chaperone LptM [Steroidobacteraceae bacterium]
MKRLLAVFSAMCALLAVAAACGQKGPLFLPDHNGTVITRPAGSAGPGTAPPPGQPTSTPQASPISTPASAAPANQTPPSASPRKPDDKTTNDEQQPPQ